MKNRSEVMFEVEETIVVRENAPTLLFCGPCGRDVPMLTPQAAGMMAGLTEREIFRFVESDLVHFIECGRVLICIESVKALGKEVEL